MILEKIENKLLMVSLEENALEVGSVIQQYIKHVFGRWAAINIITKKNCDCSLDGPTLPIGIHLSK